MIDSIKAMPVITSNTILLLTILWIAVPFYFLFLTLFAPVIIIIDDSEIKNSIKKSVFFIKTHLSKIVVLLTLTGVFWYFAFYFMKAYNNLWFVQIIFLYFSAVLEVFTIKLFISYYKGEKDEKNI